MKKTKFNFSNFFSDEKLQLITGQIFIGHGILIAYELGLFRLISKSPMPIHKIAKKMHLHKRSIQALISCASSLNLVKYNKNGYQLSPIGNSYLNEQKNGYYGNVFDLLIQQNEIMNYESIKKVILTNLSKDHIGENLFNSEGLGNTESFVKALHHKALQPAFFWPYKLSLKNSNTFVDIGGGSGIHTISACLKNSHLNGIVCERETVVPYTQQYIKDFDLENRIKATAFNMWNDKFPKGDVYFFGDIFHDWNKEKCTLLAKKSFDSLPVGGMIILHEMLFNNSKTGPLLTSAYNMKMLIWTEGQQYSSKEIQDILKEAGFKKIKLMQSLGNWSLITGTK